MSWEWIRFSLCALCLLGGLVFFLLAAWGVNKRCFHVVLNRIHAASLGDTMGLLLIAMGTAMAVGSWWAILKIVFIVAFMWFTSPVSAHLLSEVEAYTSRKVAALEIDEEEK